ncbi:MAG: NUDIX hydrolase [Caulobacteraceae bacterium]
MSNSSSRPPDQDVVERPASRVLLFDRADRLLLMRSRVFGAWFTIGGAIEPGESAREAAAREIVEETGFTDAVLGPQVWYGEEMFPLFGRMTLTRDHYFVARCKGGEPSRAAWTALELEVTDDIRWWRLADLARYKDVVYPIGLAELAVEIAKGVYPKTPRVIARL